MFAIIKKEVKSYFLSPVGYIFIGSFLLLSSIFFYIFAVYQSMEYSYLFYYTSELLTFTIAILTMGMFAGERKNGTETLLLTSPRSITSIVIGKFLAALIVILITEAFSLMYYVILCIFAGGITNIVGTLVVLLGFLLLAMSYISFGGFISSLTDNQIIAGVVTIICLLATWFLPDLYQGFSMISPISQFDMFVQGTIPIAGTVGMITQTIMFTLLTVVVLQRKKSVK